MINKVTLIGNLGSDPEIKHLESGAMVARLSVATNENYKDKDGNWQKQTEWHNVIAWRELAERADKMLKKGHLVFVEGKISYRKYQDKDGVEKYITDIVASNLRTLEKREGDGSTSAYMENRIPSEERAPAARPMMTSAEAYAPPRPNPVASSQPAAVAPDGTMPQEGDDLPF